MIFFFFSSRRRHTRFDCDWSSDVCSSDLIRKCDVKSKVQRPMSKVSSNFGHWTLVFGHWTLQVFGTVGTLWDASGTVARVRIACIYRPWDGGTAVHPQGSPSLPHLL